MGSKQFKNSRRNGNGNVDEQEGIGTLTEEEAAKVREEQQNNGNRRDGGSDYLKWEERMLVQPVRLEGETDEAYNARKIENPLYRPLYGADGKQVEGITLACEAKYEQRVGAKQPSNRVWYRCGRLTRSGQISRETDQDSAAQIRYMWAQLEADVRNVQISEIEYQANQRRTKLSAKPVDFATLLQSQVSA